MVTYFLLFRFIGAKSSSPEFVLEVYFDLVVFAAGESCRSVEVFWFFPVDFRLWRKEDYAWFLVRFCRTGRIVCVWLAAVKVSRPKTSREWHPHLSYCVSEPTNLNPIIY